MRDGLMSRGRGVVGVHVGGSSVSGLIILPQIPWRRPGREVSSLEVAETFESCYVEGREEIDADRGYRPFRCDGPRSPNLSFW